MVTSVRGLAYLEITMRGPRQDLHFPALFTALHWQRKGIYSADSAWDQLEALRRA